MSDRIELTAAELDGLAKRLVGERFAAIDVDDVFEWEHMPLLHQDQAEQLSEYIAKRLAESTAARRGVTPASSLTSRGCRTPLCLHRQSGA